MKYSLCLSGGGARGSFHLGVLEYLNENNIEIEHISGSSIGSIIACSYASGLNPKEILEIFKTEEIKKCIKFNYFKKGLFTVDLNASIIKTLLPINEFCDLNKNVFVCVYDTNSKKINYLNNGNIKSACLASSALIPIFSPVKDKDKLYIDGGLKDNLPIKPLLNFKNEIISVDLFPQKEGFAIDKKVLRNWYKDIDYSISKSTHYITNIKLRKHKILSFENLDLGFELGYQSCEEYFNKN